MRNLETIIVLVLLAFSFIPLRLHHIPHMYRNYYWCLQITHKSKISEFAVVLNDILSLTSQSHHVFIVGDLNINLLDPIAIENDFINNCHSNSLIPLNNKPTRNANNNPSIIDHIWTNQLYDTFNGIFI